MRFGGFGVACGGLLTGMAAVPSNRGGTGRVIADGLAGLCAAPRTGSVAGGMCGGVRSDHLVGSAGSAGLGLPNAPMPRRVTIDEPIAATPSGRRLLQVLPSANRQSPIGSSPASERSARSANIEAAAHFERGIAILKSLPEGARRDEWELALQVARIAPLQNSQGHGSSETEHAAASALALSPDLSP